MTTETPRRPGSRQISIEDCRGVIIADNPTPRCPHGKFWRESNYTILPPADRKERCLMAQCAAVEYRPHAGERIVLSVPRSLGARRPLLELVERVTGGGGFEAGLRAVLESYVLEWDWTGRSDAEADAGAEAHVLPLPTKDWETVADCLTTSEMLWVMNAVLSGGDPDEMAAAAGNARAASPSNS